MAYRLLSNCLSYFLPLDIQGPGQAQATNPFLSSAPAPSTHTSQSQQIMDLFSQPAAPAPSSTSALDDLLSLGNGFGNSAPATNGASTAPAPASNPFADMFSSQPTSVPQQQTMGFGGMGMGVMGGQQQNFFQQQPPTMQQPFGGAGNNMNNVFGSNNDQGKQ